MRIDLVRFENTEVSKLKLLRVGKMGTNFSKTTVGSYLLQVVKIRFTFSAATSCLRATLFAVEGIMIPLEEVRVSGVMVSFLSSFDFTVSFFSVWSPVFRSILLGSISARPPVTKSCRCTI